MTTWLMQLAMAPTPAQNGEGPGPVYYIGLMGLFMAIFYMVLIRPQRKREQERRAMIDNVKKGDRVIFSGGIIGVIANAKEKSFTIKIADNVKVEVSRGAVSHVLEKGEMPDDIEQAK